MNTIFVLLSVQAVLGALDNLWHHELQARLPQRASARLELSLHAAREAIYGIVFLGLGWLQWHGGFAWLLCALLVAELFITLADFLEEDRTRRLPPFERVLHTVLTICYGLCLGLMAPVLRDWAQQPTAWVPTPHGWVSWLFTLYGLGVLAWSVRNARAVVRLRREVAAAALRSVAPPTAHVHRIAPAVLVTGATGFVGRALVDALLREGRRVIVLSRDGRQARALFGAGVRVVESLDDIPSETRVDAVVQLAGARVLGLPWTAARRQVLLSSRTDLTIAVVKLMQRLQQPPRVLVAASAVGYYGAGTDTAEPLLGEDAPPRPSEFQSALCVAIEHEARRAEGLGVRVVRLRLGIVLGRGDGAYPMLALSARLGLGARLGSGRQPMPWIHLDDAVGLVRFALSNARLSGAVNAVAPELPTQARFNQALSHSFGRRAWLCLPAWPTRAVLGEMSTLLFDGQNVVPRVAQSLGYRFVHPQLSSALEALAGSDDLHSGAEASRGTC